MNKQDIVNDIINYMVEHKDTKYIDISPGVDYWHCHSADTIRGNIFAVIRTDKNILKFKANLKYYLYDGQMKSSKLIPKNNVTLSLIKVNVEELKNIKSLLS